MTVWEGKLVHSCRMDEWRLYGGYIQPQPRNRVVEFIAPERIPVIGHIPSDN
jgi:hypothetical protein